MKRFLFLFLFLLVGCEDDTAATGGRSLADKGLTFVENGDVRVLIPRDMRQREPDQFVYIVDARMRFDMIIDAAPPAQVCRRWGMKEECTLPDFEGPCAQGERICRETEWSDCVPINFPRQEVCDAIDNDCDGRLNESPLSQNEVLSKMCYTGAPGTDKNGPCRSGISLCEEVMVNTDAGVIIAYEYGDCQNQIVPSEEECDSVDNDCDRSTDEGVLNACAQCGEVPVEECDGIDNDCDDSTDEGLLNACDECGPLPEELCDFVDNDCDGEIDEDAGDCECDNPLYVPQPEKCNGFDDDCDDFIDEGPGGGPLTSLCATNQQTGEVETFARREDGPNYVGGDCRLGLAICESRRVAGEEEYGYFECQEEILPRNERCNEEDDDCDGIADENFQQGSVAVMMVVDVSGSMQDDELFAAFNATRDTVSILHAQGVQDVCYMLAVVGNDEMEDPYLQAYADNCVPGVEDPPIVPVEDMRGAVVALQGQIAGNLINQGGATENTYDAIGKFFTDDLLDWDNDGFPDEVEWATNRPGLNPVHTTDLSQYTHRIVVILGDERGQGALYDEHTAAMAMARSGGMVFIIGPAHLEASYSQLMDNGAVRREMGRGLGRNDNVENITEAIVEAIEEAACINRRVGQPAPDGGVDDGGVLDAGLDGGLARNLMPLVPNYKETSATYRTDKMWSVYRMCF